MTNSNLKCAHITYDVRRFNKPKFSTPGLEDNVVKQFERLFGGRIAPSSTEIEQTLRPLLQIFLELSQTAETIAVKTLINEILEHIQQQKPMQTFKATQMILYINGLGPQKPQSLEMLSNGLSRESTEGFSNSLSISNYTGTLNFQFINDYLEKFAPVLYSINKKVEDSSMDDVPVRMPKATPEARNVLNKYLEMKRIAVLLGDNTFMPTSLSFYSINNIEEFMAGEKEYKKSELPINTFLYHLMLTRNPTNQLFSKIKDDLRSCLIAVNNLERFTMLEKHFGMS